MSIIEILGSIFANIGCINKPQTDFFTELFNLLFSMQGRVNFENLSRFSTYNECTFRRHFGKFFDWLNFNHTIMQLAQIGTQGEIIAALDCSFIPKSGNKTFGVDKFWSGAANRAIKGLEISLLAFIDVKTSTAWSLDVTQTPAKLNAEKGGKYTRTDFFIEQLADCTKYLKNITYIVADSFYAKKKMFDHITLQKKHLITKLRTDANLLFKFEGAHPVRKGPKAKYDGKVVYNDMSKWHFYGKDEKYDYINIYYRICYSPQFKRQLMVVMIINTKTKKYAILGSSDTAQNAQQILTYYQLRFQIEFLFRDAKQFTGLLHCQARDEQKLDFHFNLALAAVNVAQLLRIKNPSVKSMNSLVRSLYNTRLITFLLDQLNLNDEFDIFHPKVQKVINLGAM